MKPYTYHPQNTDRYLVDILSTKTHDFLRSNIEQNASLIEVYNIFEKLKLLDNEDAINFKSSLKNLNKKYKFNNNFQTTKNSSSSFNDC